MSSSSSEQTGDESFTLVTNKKNLKRKSRKNTSNSSSDDQSDAKSVKKAAATQLQPIVLASSNDRPLSSINPTTIDRCLRKSIGQYESCKPIRSGNLIINCKTSNQVKTLLNLDCLSDNNISFPIKSSAAITPCAKEVIYNVLLDISNNELLICLKEHHVKYIKRFQIKSVLNGKSVFNDTKTVLLQFNNDVLPPFVRIGSLNFQVKQYVPKPLRYFKCNRFGHTSTNCTGKERCSKCGGDHKIENCQITIAKCVNCNGNHSAASKECPRYQKEVQVLKIQTDEKLTYAEAAKQYKARGSGDSIQYSNSSVYRYNSLCNNNAPCHQMTLLRNSVQVKTNHKV